MRLIKIGLFFILSVHSVIAQDTPEAIIDSFFVLFESEGVDQAVDYIYASNPWISGKTDAIRTLKNQMSNLKDEEFIGEFYGYDPIVNTRLGDRYLLYAYLVRFDRQPVRFTFQFYMPNDSWRLHSFKYDDNWGDELEESVRVYFLNNRY
ncbi:MAG: hypothetical protein AAF741_03365 [Bacteroidota bacterium]